ncbi:hypothetical protein SISSUDRAFT_1067420 [Sistotremastrum suecicum HHB10207 ss-3]|uniref:RING-type E3 ubiquitin transferase n=1 Tax=Sistotremastrum suecicum HHB10207 ss-3 TaxID=1314776 RepID=A0A165X576_9AGAM|nr:hypothetical protein SISSUDRAFT_1067420 [Sistotremastrum suecicum HHB10207 ss-3]
MASTMMNASAENPMPPSPRTRPSSSSTFPYSSIPAPAPRKFTEQIDLTSLSSDLDFGYHEDLELDGLKALGALSTSHAIGRDDDDGEEGEGVLNLGVEEDDEDSDELEVNSLSSSITEVPRSFRVDASSTSSGGISKNQLTSIPTSPSSTSTSSSASASPSSYIAASHPHASHASHSSSPSTLKRSRRRSYPSDESHSLEWDCGICLETASNPCVSSCGHLFCYTDLRTWLSSPSNVDDPRCPVCKRPCALEKDVVMIFGRGRISDAENVDGFYGGEGEEEKTPRPSPRPPTSISGTSHQRSLSAPNTFPYSARSSRLPLSNLLPSLSTNLLLHRSSLISTSTSIEAEAESTISPLSTMSTVSPSSAISVDPTDLSSPASPSSLSSILRSRPPPSSLLYPSSTSNLPTSLSSHPASPSHPPSPSYPFTSTSSPTTKMKKETDNVDVHLDLLMHYPTLASGTGHVLSIVAFAIFLIDAGCGMRDVGLVPLRTFGSSSSLFGSAPREAIYYLLPPNCMITDPLPSSSHINQYPPRCSAITSSSLSIGAEAELIISSSSTLCPSSAASTASLTSMSNISSPSLSALSSILRPRPRPRLQPQSPPTSLLPQSQRRSHRRSHRF